MKTAQRSSAYFLLAGTVLGFLGCVFLGYQTANYSKPKNFKRFYQRLSLDGQFFPPFPMQEHLALARWSPGKIIVLVGGDSVMHGIGQPEERIWTHELQKRLGERRYVVVNLALRGANAAEGGALVAEALIKQGFPVIYVANARPGSPPPAYDGAYRYIYWDAFYKGRLLPFPEREADVAAWISRLRPDERRKVEELALAERFDSLLRFQSLWHHVTYRHFSATWNSIVLPRWWEPRIRFTDPEPEPPPLEYRYRASEEEMMRIARGYTEGLARAGKDGVWVVDRGALEALSRAIPRVFPAPLRTRMLLILHHSSPHYLAKLSPAELRRDATVYESFVRQWNLSGVRTFELGNDFDEIDYADRVHLSPSGGSKMAQRVAREVEALAATELFKTTEGGK